MDPPLQQTLDSQPNVNLRRAMPKLQEEPKLPSLLTLMKGFIGKDLNTPLPLPVGLTEPSTEIMKRAEDIEYSELLDEAADLPKGSLARLLKVAAYALSPYSSCHADRTCKPLFSGPQETLEAVYPEKGVRFIAESIQDGGWIVAGHMEGRKWTLATDDHYKPKIWGPSMDFIPNWFLELTFADGEVYTWQKAITSVNNLLSGPMFVSHRGSLRVTQQSSGRVAVIKFKEPGMTSLSTKGRKTANRPVVGHIEENSKQLSNPVLSGFWDSHLDVTFDGQKPQTLWRKNPLPANNNRFQMTHFMIGLADLPPEVKPLLPPTDSRVRVDMHLLEEGLYTKGREEKERLEARMFASVAANKKGGKSFIQPTWFHKEADGDSIKPGEGIRWRYSGTYWAARQKGFEGLSLPELFS